MDIGGLEIRVARSENLPVLPQVVTSVLRAADNPNTTPRDLERLIERDASISGKVMRVANSAFYGSNKVSTIGRAISILGINTLKSLIVSIAYQQMVGEHPSKSSFDRIAFWQHSLAVAAGSRIIGKLKMPSKAEELYGAGMLHDVGKLVLERFAPNEFDAALRQAKQDEMPLYLAEPLALGFTHCDIGKILAEKWCLVPSMRQAIEFHHNPSGDGEYFEMTAIVSAANTIAHRAEITEHKNEPSKELDASVANWLGLDEEQLATIQDLVSQEVASAQAAFNF
ncbi:MAG: hypothetical protein HONBIEJF_02665 [Fimbriimonadaceae bacterium]|nr:hypothetical protein [Fimbriimonadaceae bacterium]